MASRSSLVAGVAVCVSLLSATGGSEPVRALPDDEAFLSLDFEAFDQTPETGWRPLDRRGEYLEAAHLIDAYRERRAGLDGGEHTILAFHDAQEYAFAGRDETALERLSQAEYPSAALDRQPSEDKAFGLAWNAYVQATAAFLRHDRKRLSELREVIARAPLLNGKPMNLDVVDRLLAHFDESYKVAYGSP